MGVEVSINHLHIGPTAVSLHHLNVANPEGSILNTALKAQKIQANLPLTALFRQEIVIDKMVLSDLYLDLEFESATDTRGNWTILINNLRSSLDKMAASESTKDFLIKNLIVTNINIDLIFKKGDGKVRHLKPIPRMEFKNVSSTGPFPVGQLVNVVMTEILKEIFLKEHLKNMLQELIQSPAKGIYNSFKSLFPKQAS